jgi:hypothetical protein
MNKTIKYFLGAAVLLFIGMILQSASGEAGPTSDQIVQPDAVTINQTDSVKYIAFNSREIKADYKVSCHVELVENSGTVTTTFTLQGSNFPPSLGFWDDISAVTLSDTGDSTITTATTSPSYAYYRLAVAKATNSGNYSVTVNASAKFNTFWR